MKTIKAIHIGGYMRIIAVAIVILLTLIFGSKAYCIAPHMPDMALQAELDMHRQSVEAHKDRKASEKVSKYKESRSKRKKQKEPKQKKPKRPSKEDRKRARRDTVRNSV